MSAKPAWWSWGAADREDRMFGMVSALSSNEARRGQHCRLGTLVPERADRLLSPAGGRIATIGPARSTEACAMRMIDDRTGLEALGRDECLRLLAAHHIGRVAVVYGGRPFIFPVNYVVDGGSVLFRTAEGTKLDGVTGGFPVAFEIDGADDACHSGWSVLVSGTGRRVVDAHELAAVAELRLRPWAPGEKPHWVRIRAETVTGRRIITLRGN